MRDASNTVLQSNPMPVERGGTDAFATLISPCRAPSPGTWRGEPGRPGPDDCAPR